MLLFDLGVLFGYVILYVLSIIINNKSMFSAST
jgi:hypothetical protein